MPRNTTNVSLRTERPIKALRRESVSRGEADESNRTPGASGTMRQGRKRPGRAASLRTSNAGKRSQKWRSVAKGKLKRNPSPAKRAQKIRERA
jgi:hypothetical protein